jgi:hypothetical protein
VVALETYLYSILNCFPRVFGLPLPRNAQKRTEKKKKREKVRTYLFLRAGADVRRFPVLFLSAPLLPTMSQPKTKQTKNARLEVHANFLPPDQYYRRQQAAAHSLASPGDKWQVPMLV